MKLGEIQEFFVREGIRMDPRPQKRIRHVLSGVRAEWKKCPARDRKFFDKERLNNPYADSRILNGDPDREVRRILVGIDIELGELLLVDRLNSKGRGIDLVLAHHPEGIALAGLDEVMELQTDGLEEFGIRRPIAKELMRKRMSEVSRRLHSANHERTVDAARLLGLPLMCCHTPADNHVADYLQKKIDRWRPKTLKDLTDLLMTEPEYREAAARKAGPRILVGVPKDPAGRVLVDMTGGTEGPKDVFARLSHGGLDTLLGMHLSEDHYSRVKDEHIKVVIAGHIASDNLGLNLLLDKLERKAAVEIIAASGFRRFSRPWA